MGILIQARKLKRQIGKEVYQFEPGDQIGNMKMECKPEYYTKYLGKVERISHTGELVYIGGLPYGVDEFFKHTEPTQSDGYIHWMVR